MSLQKIEQNYTHESLRVAHNEAVDAISTIQTELEEVKNSSVTSENLPVAGESLGAVKSGGDVTIDENGVITVNNNSHNHTVENILDFPSTLPASDVYEWAKAESKPTYTASEVGADTIGSANTALESAKAYADIQDATILASANDYTDTKVSDLINSAPTTLDTLGEIAAAMTENKSVVEALDSAVGSKANTSDLTSHTSNTSNPHSVTKAQVGLGDVENKSSATIRGEITKANVTDALGYTPMEDTTVPITKGGTGATTVKAAEYNLLKDIPESTAELADNAIFVFKKTTPDSTNGVFVWKYASLIWNYIQNKISSVLGLTASQYNGNASTATKATTINTVAGTDDIYRNVLFNNASDTTKVCYDTNFQYNPATKDMKLGSVTISDNVTLTYDSSTESVSFNFK